MEQAPRHHVPSVRLNVPFVSQYDGSASADANCAPASLSMALGALGVAANPAAIRARATVLDPATAVDDGVTFTALATVATEAGMLPIVPPIWTMAELRNQLEQGHPVMVALCDPLLTGDCDHAVVVTGFTSRSVILNDPGEERRPRGGGMRVPTNLFDRAWNTDLDGGRSAIAFARGPA